MGLFDLFKKKSEDNNEPKPQEQMLTLNERQKPALKSSSKPPTAPPQAAQPESIMLTPDPTVNKTQETAPNFDEQATPEPEEQEYLRENLSTKSLEKGIQSMPNVKKLVIPSNNEAMSQKVEATDTVTAERVMKQVDLPGTEKPKEDIAPSTPNYVPGEFIDLPISFFTDSIEQKYLSANSQTLFDNSSKIRFTKDEILSIMAQGAFAVVGSALLARFPQDMVSEQGKTTSEVFEFALDAIMALVPPDWFSLQGQDESLVSSLNNMSNPFQDLEEPEEEEKIVEETQKEPENNSLFSDDEDEEELSVETEEEIDPLATMEQVAPPSIIEEEEIDPLETMEQVAPPVAQKAKAVTDDNTLVVDTATISAALSPEIFTAFPSDTALAIPRKRVLQSLAEGVFTLTASEVDQFAGTSNAKPGKLNEAVAIELNLIMGLIPPEWFSLQGQDNSQNELLSNMSDVFDDSTFEEAVKEFEQNESLGETVVDVDREENVDHQEVNVEEEDDEEQEVSIEEEDEEQSLITGGIFGKMNGLFEDDDEEQDISIEEENDEQAAVVQNFIEEEDEAVTLVIEDETETLTEIQPETETSESVEEVETIEKDQSNLASDSMPTLVQLTPPPKAEKPVEAKKPKEETAQAKTIEKDFDVETKNVPDAGKVTYRAVNDDVPDISDTAILRPSTAPNGIDINRSNLADLCRLHSAGEKLAQTLIEYREQNGDFKSVNELINVPGVGSSVYKSLTGLRPSSDLVAAERRINKSVGLETDKDYSLGRIIKEAQKKFGFKSIILSDKDGFEICFSGDKSLLESNSELLAATTPQLFKKTKHFLKQSLLPHPEVFTFYLEETPVTFGIADEVYMVMVHSSKWPEPKHMKKCRTLINELAWFCSYRAIV